MILHVSTNFSNVLLSHPCSQRQILKSVQARKNFCLFCRKKVFAKMWPFGSKGGSGFSSKSTAEEVTDGIDGTGLTAIVTGASSGIGTETARVLALRGVHAVMAVRSVESGNKVKEQIIKKIPSAKVDVMQLDLSSMASVRKFGSEFISSGIMAPPFSLSQDNIELQFATNHVGHFLLTDLLLDTMKRTVRESNREGRIVIVSSEFHRFTYREGIRFDKINDESRYNKYYAYGQSKLANILHANELARRLKEEGVDITANSLHPGSIKTNLHRHQSVTRSILNMVGKFFLKTYQQGASTTCYVALHPQVNGVTGEYFMGNNLAKPSTQARDVELARKLWDFSLRLINRK